MPLYIAESALDVLAHDNQILVGVKAENYHVYLYRLRIDATPDDIRAWPPSVHGRGVRRSPTGTEPWWICVPRSGARWPGTGARSGPTPIEEHDAPPGRHARSTSPPSHLGEAEKRWISRRILELLGARESRFRDVVKRLIGDLLRRWTSDGVGTYGVEVEALWIDFDRLPSTQRAREAAEQWATSHRRGRRQFIHEHVVPVDVLREWLLVGTNRTEEEVYRYLDRFCLATLIHREEDRLLKPYRHTMPAGWSEGAEAEPWSRYQQTILPDGTSLYDALSFPDDYPRKPS